MLLRLVRQIPNFSNRRIASAGMLYYRRIFRNCQTGKGGRSVIYFALPTIRTYFSPGQSNAPFTFYSVCYFTVSHKGSISQSVQNGSFHFSQSCRFTRSDGPWWWEGTGPHPPGRRGHIYLHHRVISTEFSQDDLILP